MLPRLSAIIIVCYAVTWSVVNAAESKKLTLRHNPFTRPEVLKPKPPPPPAPAPQVVVPPEEIELELTATMVSETAPMVVVDGELLAIGEKIQGLKLISVMEGRAIFAKGRKKFAFEIGSAEQQ